MSLEILQFKAEWCGPCAQQSEILSEFDSVPVKEIDIEEEQELAQEYNVRGLPTLILEEDGSIVGRWSGLTQLDKLQHKIDEVSDK